MVRCGLALFVLLTAVWAQKIIDDPKDTDMPESTTFVWVTVTVNGAIATMRTAYFQEFLPVATAAAAVKQGTIGMGSISGDYGVTRDYAITTFSGHGNNIVDGLSTGLGFLGVIFALVA